MCNLLDVSRSGYYSFLLPKTSKRKLWRSLVLQEIINCHNKSRKLMAAQGYQNLYNLMV